jgi:hypothetical protein
MTQDGCCVDAFFSPDGSRILFLDKPSPEAVTGLWAVTLATPLAAPTLYTERLGPFSRDMTLNAFPENGRTIVERSNDNQRWTINNGGRRVLFAPNNSAIAWVVGEESGNFDVRRGDIWLANVDGTNTRAIATVYGGGVQAWFSDSVRMLISGKGNRNDITSTLSVLSLADGSVRKLVDVERLRGLALSPDDRTLAYYVAQARDATQDGMYLLDVATPAATPQRLSFFGAYRWCSPTRLLYVPLKPGAPSNELWRYDLTSRQSTPLISVAADSLFKIANGNWDVSSDGRRVLYLNARDRNLWIVTLPDAC